MSPTVKNFPHQKYFLPDLKICTVLVKIENNYGCLRIYDIYIYVWYWILLILYCTLISGLHLTLNLNQKEYLSEVDDSAGARLVILPQRHMPFPEDEGITLHPGSVTYAGIKQVCWNYLPLIKYLVFTNSKVKRIGCLPLLCTTIHCKKRIT